MRSSILIFFSISLLVEIAICCNVLQVSSQHLGNILFHQIPIDQSDNIVSVGNGRPSYYSKVDEKVMYLYHTISNSDTGMWVINNELNIPDRAVAFRRSWAVEPQLIYALVENESAQNYWTVIDGESSWINDASFDLFCTDESVNSILFFESSRLQPGIGGYYIERALSTENPFQSKVFALVPQHPSFPICYLYHKNSHWMIGPDYSTDGAFAIVNSDASHPSQIDNVEWQFVNESSPGESQWARDYAIFYYFGMPFEEEYFNFSTIYDVTRFARSIKFIPSGQEHLTMRNNVPIPSLGLGTGGIPLELSRQVFKYSLENGYRNFDLAREYQNEYIFSDLFNSDEKLPIRSDVFLQSKVWPTDLGIYPTSNALLESLYSINSNYIDSYLLHWPSCEKSVSWMHCETTVDPNGTWQSSWRALEKAYAEGLVNSIGVSNFNRYLLEELETFADVLPHIVQNFAEPGSMDDEVRAYCKDHEIIFQPYASGRNINNLNQETLAAVKDIALKYNLAEYAVILRFFLQSGFVSVIPRSTNPSHLLDNLKVFDWSLSDEDMERLGWSKTFFDEL